MWWVLFVMTVLHLLYAHLQVSDTMSIKLLYCFSQAAYDMCASNLCSLQMVDSTSLLSAH